MRAIIRGTAAQNSSPRNFIMHKGRLEAFSDGVIAIIITIMVLVPDRRIEKALAT
jgi:uncharacterized membrane protein